MSATALEAFLARIYVDPKARARFKANPWAELNLTALTDEECAALVKMDFTKLEMTARSFACKRQAKSKNLHSLRFHFPRIIISFLRALKASVETKR